MARINGSMSGSLPRGAARLLAAEIDNHTTVVWFQMDLCAGGGWFNLEL
jgi:hypothetical protein